MFLSPVVRRSFRDVLCGAAVLLLASPGKSAEPDHAKLDHRACVATYKNARAQQQANHLRAAQELAESCAKPACGAAVRQECSIKYNQLDNDIPSFVPVAVDDNGAPLTDVQVRVDGELLISKLDGRALPLDPGVHEVSFSAANAVTVTEKVMIVQGQHNRAISVAMQSPAARALRKTTLMASVVPTKPVETKTEPKPGPAADKPSEPAPRHLLPEKSALREPLPEPAPREHRGGPGVLPYVLGGAGLAAVGAGTLFFVWGKNDNSALSQCTPNCAPSTLTRIKTLYAAGDISIGAGVAALGVATYLYATSSGREKAPPKAAYSLDVEPTRNGAFATVSGSF